MPSRNAHWDGADLAALQQAGPEELPIVAKEINKHYGSCVAVRRLLKAARKARRECPAFLPDDGVPYAVKMMAVHQD